MDHLNPYRAPENLGAAVEAEGRTGASRAVAFSFVTAILGLGGAINCAVALSSVLESSVSRRELEMCRLNCWVTSLVLAPVCAWGLLRALKASKHGDHNRKLIGLCIECNGGLLLLFLVLWLMYSLL